MHKLLQPGDSHSMLRFKMLAVCAGAKGEPRLDVIVEELLAELALEVTAAALEELSLEGNSDPYLHLRRKALLLALRRPRIQ